MFESAAGGGVRARRATAGTAVLMAMALAASVTAVVLSSPAWAATLTVETASDEPDTNDHQCSLREAITNANGNDQSGSTDCPAGGGVDEIVFGLAESPATITLTSQLPALTDGDRLTVDGADSGVTISGAGQVRVFEVDEGAKLALKRLKVADGNSAPGPGGGVLNRGSLTVSGSTLSGNNAGSGGGIHNLGMLTVSSSTLFDNSAGQSGGGIEHAGGSAKLKNTIVADGPSGENPSGENCHRPLGGSVSRITDGGYNLSSDRTCGFSKDNRSHPGLDPELGPLADNGGPTPTHALRETSRAVDKGRSFGAGADQRGLPRPTDLGETTNASGGDGSDIGAYEMVKCSGDVVNAAGTIFGDAGPNKLNGGPGDDFIFGLGGNDTITGGGGNDEVCSGKGNDTIYGGEGNDKLLGGEGKDKLWGGDGSDRLEGLKGDDRLDTEDKVRGNDEAYGGSGQDYCRRTDPGDKKVSCR